MRNAFVFITLAAASIAAPCAAADAFSLEGEVALVSDYRWRGLSLSDENPAILTEATLYHESGFWAWGSANSVSSDYGGSELAIGAGYTRELASIEWTAGVTRYFYPGEEDFDYNEFALSAARAFGPVSLSAGVEFTPEQDNVVEDDTYTWLGWEIAGPADVRLEGHVGEDDGAFAATPYANDFSIGAAVPIHQAELGLAYIESDSEGAAWVLRLAYSP